MQHVMNFKVGVFATFIVLLIAFIAGPPLGTAQAANCGGLPVSGGVIPPGTYTMTDNCTISATLEIAGGTEVTINGNDFFISGSNSMRVILVDSGAMLNLNGVIVANGTSTEQSRGGGGALNYGAMSVTGSTFLNNSSVVSGGGISSSASLTVSGSTFSNNTALYPGGAIYGSGTMTITDTKFVDNTANAGGGVFHHMGVLTIRNSTFSRNTSDHGSGIYSEYSTLEIHNNSFSNNSSEYFGGGIYMRNGESALFSDNTFSGNIANHTGGGIYNIGTPLTVSNSLFSGNVAQDGGGISNRGPLMVRNSIFVQNSAGRSGGAVYHISTDKLDGNPNPTPAYNYTATITCSKIVNNATGSGTDVHFDLSLEGGNLIPDNNWWGAETGPNTPGADTTNVFVTSWLSEPDPACAAVVGAVEPAPPMLNEITDGEVVAYDVPDGFYGRILMQDGAWMANPGTIPQELIDNGVVLAIDIFQLSGEQENNEFGAYVPVCLLGSGRLIFLDATTSPRTMVELETFTMDGMTCGWIPNAGTLVLIEGDSS